MSEKGLSPSQDGAPPTRGWAAVSHFCRYALGMLEPGEKAPPLPEGLYDWPQTLVPGFLAGALHGGVTQWKETAPQWPAARTPSFTLQRVFRVLDAANRRGIALGSLAALFFGVEMLGGVYRGRRQYLSDAALGGLAVSAVFTAHRCLRTPTWPPPNLGGNVSAIIGISLIQGALQSAQHTQQLREAAAAAAAEEERKRQEAAAAHSAMDAASALLAQLESQLSHGGPVLHDSGRQQEGDWHPQQQQQQGGWALQQQQGGWHQQQQPPMPGQPSPPPLAAEAAAAAADRKWWWR